MNEVRRSSRLALVVGLAVAVIVACGPEKDDERTGRSKQQLRTSPQLSDFAVYATNSVSLMDRAQVLGGDVGVERSGTPGPFLVNGFEAALAADAKIELTYDLLAQDVYLRDRAAVGDVGATNITNQFGNYANQYALPPMPAAPTVAAPVPGSSDYSVSAGQTQTLSPGGYATVTVNGTLRLSGGTYEFATLDLGNDGRLQALATAEVHIAGRLHTGDRARIETSGGSLTAKDLRVEVSGQNGTTGALHATPKAVALGNDTVIRALMLAPNGTLQTGHRTNVTGALFARDVLVHLDAKVTFQDGFAGQECGSCDDQNACTADACNAGSCTHTPAANGTACNDQNSCTASDTCQNGACIGGAAVVCQPSDVCHVAGSCDPATGVCSNPAKPDGTACGSNACSPNDHCEGGACVPGPTTTCSPSGPCFLAGTCNPTTGACSNPPAPAGSPCGDANVCTGIEACDGLGACVAGIPPVVDDGNPCTIDTCDPVFGAVHTPAPSGTACGNGNACDGAETCNGAGACVAGAAPVVDDQNPCTDDACDPVTGVTHTPRPAGDLACNDNDACNGVEQCNGNGACTPGMPPALDDGNRCTVDECSPIAGPIHTPIPGCDPTPTGADERFETRASLLGKVVDRAGAPITNATFDVYDERRTGAPRTDVVARVGSDGTFRLRLTSFPEIETERAPVHRLALVVSAPGKIPAERVAFARPGDATPLGAIRLIDRDPQITNIGPSGGTASDSSNRIQIVIPAGALTATVPIQITPLDEREDFPAPLPSATLTAYGMELEPSGTVFAVPVTVRVANTRNLPTTLTIPAGFYNSVEGHWDTLGEGVWDGSRFAFQTTHFTTADLNPSQLLDLVLHWARDMSNNDKGDKKCGTGSSWSMGGGSTSDRFPLPTVHAGGEGFGIALHYDSGLAGSRKTGVATASEPATEASAVPVSSLAASISGTKMKTECVSRGGGGGSTNTPGGCSGSSVVGTCGGGGGALTLDLRLIDVLNQIGLSPPPNATELTDGSSWMNVPFATDGAPTSTTPLARTGFFPQSVGITSRTSATCGGGGGGSAATFGASNPLLPRFTLPLEQGPLATLTRRVLVQHRFSSPYGAGWAIDAASRVYVDGDHAVLVDGSGQQEEFHPRARLDTAGLTTVPSEVSFTRDTSTGESFVYLRSSGTVERIEPTTGARTVVVSSTGLSNLPVHGLAVAYVNGARRFVISNQQGIYDVPPGGSPRLLVSKLAGPSVFRRRSIAARGATVFFTTGDDDAERDVLFKLDLTAGTPVPEAVSVPASASASVTSDHSLFPSHPLGQVTFTALKGLAFGPDGSLYTSDSRRHMVYRISPDPNGAIGAASRVVGVVGNGGGTLIPPTGERFPGERFGLNQPHHLAMSEDGYLFIAHGLGVAVYDTQSKEAEMLFLDGGRDEIPASLTEQSNPPPSLLPLGKNLMLATSDAGVVRVQVDLLSSEREPTRTIVRDPSGGLTLTDTAQAIIERFDSHGRLVEQRRRTGKPIYAIQYVDADSDRIERITNSVGGAFTFTYDGGKLSRITDPAGGASVFAVDAQGDLTSIVEPDGERHRFGYDRHHLTTKTSPRGEETLYTYAADGTVSTTQKPTGEAYELHASNSTGPTYDVNGQLQVGGSFTDPHGVVHTFFQNDWGGVEKEIYVADGITYTREAVVPTELFTTGTEPFAQRRLNRVVRRVSRWTLNGVPLTPLLSFDSLGRVVGRARLGESSSLTTRWTYDANGWLASEGIGGGNQTQYIERDPLGRILRIYDGGRDTGTPSGREATFTWRDDDQPLTMQVRGVTTTFSYDDGGGSKNLVSTSDSQGRSMTYGYDARGNVISTSDGTASAVFDFDANNRLVRTSDALGNETTLRYTHGSCGCSEQDLVTGLRTPDLPAGTEWAFEYGADGRLTKVTDPDGFDESISYKPTGEIASATDRLGRTSTMSYDQLGRLTSLIDIGNRAHARSYTRPTAGAWVGPSLGAGSASSAAPPTSLTDSLQGGDYQIGFNAYDTEGHPARISLYRDATFELAYTRQFDVAGRLTRRFDRANRSIASVDLPRGAGDGSYDDHLVSYDSRTAMPRITITESSTATGAESSFTQYNAELDATSDTGFGTGIERPSSHVFTRDAGGRLTDVTNRFYTVMVSSGPALVMNAPPSHYDYRPDGRISRITNADGRHDFTYDARGLAATQVVDQGTDNPGANLDRDNGTYTYGYDEVGRNTSLTYSDGHVRTQRYDALGRIVERCYKYPLQPSIADRCYNAAYDAAGNVTRLTDPEGSDDVVVDDLDRLRSVTRSGGGGGVETYAYNALGALTTNAGVAVAHQRPRLDGGGVADAAVPSTLAGQPVTLDRGGRVTSVRGVTFQFSRSGYLRETSTGARFAVDTAQRRAVQTSEYGLEAFAYEGANIIGVVHRDALTSTDTIDEQWLYDGVDHPLRLTTSRAASGQANVVYFELDLAGNVRRVRGANGEDYGGYRYTAFGQTVEDTATATLAGLTPSVTQRVRWKGRPVYHFGGTEVYDMRARQWVPELGAFLSIDEYAFQDPHSTLWGWPGQNPIRWRDPTGRSGAFVWGSGAAHGPALSPVRVGGEGVGLAGWDSTIHGLGFYTGGIVAPGVEVGGEANFAAAHWGWERTSDGHVSTISLGEVHLGIEAPFLLGAHDSLGFFYTDESAGLYWGPHLSALGEDAGVGFGLSISYSDVDRLLGWLREKCR